MKSILLSILILSIFVPLTSYAQLNGFTETSEIFTDTDGVWIMQSENDDSGYRSALFDTPISISDFSEAELIITGKEKIAGNSARLSGLQYRFIGDSNCQPWSGFLVSGNFDNDFTSFPTSIIYTSPTTQICGIRWSRYDSANSGGIFNFTFDVHLDGESILYESQEPDQVLEDHVIEEQLLASSTCTGSSTSSVCTYFYTVSTSTPPDTTNHSLNFFIYSLFFFATIASTAYLTNRLL